jgi:C4-dicarboxylate transporter DctQ subunit
MACISLGFAFPELLMKKIQAGLRHFAQAVAAAMMALMFLTFMLQIFVRYSARLEWLSARFPILDPTLYGWTLEFCLLLWVWLVFWGNAFVVRERDHVTFDILFHAVRPAVRRWFIVISGVAICVGLMLSVEPTWSKFYILRLKKTATLSTVFGDWIRMRDVYSIYIFFLIAVALRYAWAVYRAIRFGVEEPPQDTARDTTQ